MAAAPDLNPQQQAAVDHVGGPLLVLAGAGSGKTGVITRKIAQLIRGGHPAERIAAVTFTNKAAHEMRSRVTSLLDKQATRGLLISTFHSLGLRLLHSEHAAAGLKPRFSIFDAEDCDKLLGDLLGNDQALRNTARWTISRWKTAGVTPDEAVRTAESDGETRMARAYSEYDRHLRAYNAVDFDDLLALPVRLLEADPALRDRWQNRFSYLLVDEYQDTNDAQYRLLKLLAGPRGAFTVVGDDDQSIYAWRGASPENIASLSQDYPQLEIIKLEQNYRSCGHILEAANRLIEGNERLYAKNLWSALGPGERLRVLPCDDDPAEADRVVSEIISHRLRGGGRYGDYAILYRGNFQARPFERMLRERGIAYRVSGGQSFFDRREVKDLVAYLRILVNPEDDAAFLRIVNLPRREIGPSTLEQLARYAGERGLGLYAAARGAALSGAVGSRGGRRLEQFANWLQQMAQLGQSEPPDGLLRQIIQDVDYRNWLRESATNPRQAEKRMENVEDFLQWVSRIADSEADKGKTADLGTVVTRLGIMDLLEQRDDGREADQVHLLTLHAAKGLEFNHVFLAGVEEGLIPHQTSLDEGNLEEERRLMYVGITRARRSLTMTYCRQRKRARQMLDCEPSRFLAELPDHLVEWEGRARTAHSPPPRSTQERLADLKALLPDE
ncbi:MAG: ATP-dependent DNA helicase Rep [Salinisphaeraceae bacterium]|nr:ATP-dependent DNA helicase Rep [Salinisphaeraceae bacterium]